MNKQLRLILFGLFFALMTLCVGVSFYESVRVVFWGANNGWNAVKQDEALVVVHIAGEARNFNEALKEGDEVVAFNGEPFTSAAQDIIASRRARPGDTYTVVVRRDGQELFYLSPDNRLMVVSVAVGTTFEAGEPKTLFRINSGVWQDYDVTADGQRFLSNNAAASANSLPITVVLNWTADLKR